MKKLLLFPLLLALTGCATNPNLIAPEMKIVQAPDELYYCPVINKFPKSETLTDRQVGILLLRYHRNNHICKQNIDKLKDYYNKAQIISEPPKESNFFLDLFK